jgi:hypothetical protein
MGMPARLARETNSTVGDRGVSVDPRRREPWHVPSRAISPGSLMRGTALATGVLAGLIWGADPVRAANECGTAPAGGGTVVCTPVGNTYPNGITYTPTADLTVVTQSGVSIISGANFGITVTGAGAQNLAVTANSGTTITNTGLGANAIALNATTGSVTINSGANITTAGDGLLATTGTGAVTVVNSGQIVTGSNFLAAGIFAQTGNGSISIVNTGTINAPTLSTGISATSGTSGTTSVINSGQISAGFGVELFGAPGATLTNTGTIIGTSAAINDGTGAGTTINQNGGAIIGDILLSASGDTVNVRGGTISGNIAGSGTTDTINFALGSNTFTYGAAFGFNTINQVNVISGTVILDGTNSATNIAVSGGNLQVGDAANPGATLTGAVSVTGGMLSGFGTVIGNVSIGNGGTLAPGGASAVGTLSVQGSLAFATAANYLVNISSTSASRTAVTGTATLAGTVQVASPTNSYRFNSPYTILTSGGRGGTTFNTVVTPTGIAGSLIYPNSTDVQLSLTSNLGGVSGLNGNQRALATRLDAAFNAGGTSGNLSGIFAGNVPLNLTQASGETAVGTQQTTFDAMSEFMGLLTDPFIGGRSGVAGSGPGATPFAEESSS